LRIATSYKDMLTISQKKATAGKEWFDLPRTTVTDELKKDLQLLRMRSVLDPKRHYKKEAVTKQNLVPEFSQMGTVVEGPTDFFSGRISRKDRRETFVEETLAQKDTVSRFKRKYSEILSTKRSGRADHYKSVMAKRKKQRKY
jgi:hypothetical protein